MIVELSADNFEATTSQDGIVLVDCWAPWCRNCDAFTKAYRQTAASHPDHVFATLNTAEQSDLSATLRVQHVPNLLVYRDGVMLLNEAGNYTAEMIEDLIQQAKGLDMVKVREEMNLPPRDAEK
jgi:thioredoxin 1